MCFSLLTSFSSAAVRLEGGTDSSNGLLQHLQNSKWHFVCDSTWHENKFKSLAVCEELGFKSSVPVNTHLLNYAVYSLAAHKLFWHPKCPTVNDWAEDFFYFSECKERHSNVSKPTTCNRSMMVAVNCSLSGECEHVLLGVCVFVCAQTQRKHTHQSLCPQQVKLSTAEKGATHQTLNAILHASFRVAGAMFMPTYFTQRAACAEFPSVMSSILSSTSNTSQT